jgi:hypothetical protein
LLPAETARPFVSTLADVCKQRRLAIGEVHAWISAIAAELCLLHERGEAHGAVAAENVCIEAHGARLSASAATSTDQSRDIVQFAALLRQMLDRVQLETESEQAQWRVLDGIATTNSQAAPGRRIKKVAMALKLLRRVPKVEIRVAEPPRPAPVRVLMLVREAPSEAPATPTRRTVNGLQVLAFLGSAACLAVAGCFVFMRFAH